MTNIEREGRLWKLQVSVVALAHIPSICGNVQTTCVAIVSTDDSLFAHSGNETKFVMALMPSP